MEAGPSAASGDVALVASPVVALEAKMEDTQQQQQQATKEQTDGATAAGAAAAATTATAPTVAQPPPPSVNEPAMVATYAPADASMPAVQAQTQTEQQTNEQPAEPAAAPLPAHEAAPAAEEEEESPQPAQPDRIDPAESLAAVAVAVVDSANLPSARQQSEERPQETTAAAAAEAPNVSVAQTTTAVDSSAPTDAVQPAPTLEQPIAPMIAATDAPMDEVAALEAQPEETGLSDSESDSPVAANSAEAAAAIAGVALSEETEADTHMAAAVGSSEEAANADADADAAPSPPASFPAFPSLGTPSPPAPAATANGMRSPERRSEATQQLTGLAALLPPDTPTRAPHLGSQQHRSPPLQSFFHSPTFLSPTISIKLEPGLTPASAATVEPLPAAASVSHPLPTAAGVIAPEPVLPSAAAVGAALILNKGSKKRRMLSVPPPTAAVAPTAGAPIAAAAAGAAAAAPRTPAKRKSAALAAKKVISGESKEESGGDGSGAKGGRKKKQPKLAADMSLAGKENATPLSSSTASSSAVAAAATAAASPELDSLDFDTLSQTEAEAERTRLAALEQRRQAEALSVAHASAAAAGGISAASLQVASDTSQCSICLSAFTSHGPHRVCCLKCGHLFGSSCIKRWVSEHKKCSTCKKAATVSDIRQLFVPSIAVADTSSMQAAQEKIQALNNELLKSKGAYIALQEEMKKQQSKYENLAVSFGRLRQKLTLKEGKGGETQLTYIMSPTIGQSPVVGAAAAAASSSSSTARPLSPSRFQPLVLQPPAPPVHPPVLPAGPRLPITHTVPAQLPPPSLPPPTLHNPRAASPTRPVIDLTRSQSQTASAAAFLHPHSAGAAAPVHSSSAPILPLMHAAPPPRLVAGSNELCFPLLDMFNVEGGRVLDFDSINANLLLSACPPQYPVTNGLAHGVVKLAVADVALRYYMPLHSKPIRDLRFNPSHQLLLSCSFDKTLRLSNVAHGSIVASWDLPQQAWSCTWNSWATEYVHVGLQTGELLTFDIRMNQTVPLFSLQLPSKQPCHSLVSVGAASDPESAVHGLIAATSAHVSLCKSSTSLKQWDLFELPLLPMQATGGMNCNSVAYDLESSAAVCAIRPSVVPPPPAAANGYALPKPTAPLCTVFQLRSDEATPTAAAPAAAAAASAAPTSLASASFSHSGSSPSKPPARWSVHLQSSACVQFEAPSRLFAAPPPAVSCTCISQLSGHRLAASLTRASIFTQKGAAPTGDRLLVACGDDDNNQCVVWDVRGERVLSRLTGQQAAITQVQHSAPLNLLATVSNNSCCLYSAAA